MPIATIELTAGCDAATKERLGAAVRVAICGVIGAEGVTVTVREGPAEGDAPDLEGVVRDYLQAMEARDLDRARGHLAPGFVMTFPGGVRMESLEALIEWSRPRYRFVTKSYERFDALGGVVYCFGTLAGEWPDGTAFAGIRFIDRFALEGGRILRQDVWNDMGEARGEARGEVRR